MSPIQAPQVHFGHLGSRFSKKSTETSALFVFYARSQWFREFEILRVRAVGFRSHGTDLMNHYTFLCIWWCCSYSKNTNSVLTMKYNGRIF